MPFCRPVADDMMKDMMMANPIKPKSVLDDVIPRLDSSQPINANIPAPNDADIPATSAYKQILSIIVPIPE